jgi:DNA-binding NarL/FixJ family response regulator
MSSEGTPTRHPTRVALAEDSLIVREGLQELLDREESIDLVATCQDRPTLMSAVEREQPDVVLTDIRMPPTFSDEGIEIANVLRETHSRIGVIVLSQYADPGYVISLFEHGSAGRGYLLKDGIGDAKELVAAVRTVAHGGSVIDPKVVESLVVAQQTREHSRLEDLTPREFEVLRLVAAGKSNKAIADALVLSRRSVEHHISAIFTKLDLVDESEVHRRVRATLLYLADNGAITFDT